MIAVVVLAALVGLTTLAGFLGGLWWRFDQLASVRPQLAVVLLLLAVVLVVARRRLAAALAGTVALAALVTVAPLFVPVDAGTPTGDRVRVLSFNLLSTNDRYDDVIRYIRRIRPDVVFLHEASLPWEEAVTEADLGLEVVVTRSPDLIFGTLVLAPPGAVVEGFGFSVGEPRAVAVRLETEGGTPVDVLGIHPLAPTSAGRAALRDAQLAYAGEWAAERRERAIVVGDFNAAPWSHGFRRLLGGSGMVDSERGFGFQPSFPSGFPFVLRIPIDHLLHSDGLEVVDRRLGPDLGSDHLPLVVDLVVTLR